MNWNFFALRNFSKIRKPARTATALLGASLLSVNIVPSSAAEVHYDPALCKADAGEKFFIALDRNVLAVGRPNSGAVIGNIDPSMHIKRLAPPDPLGQEGCPNNPMQLLNYTYFAYGIPSPNKGKLWMAERLKLISDDPQTSTPWAWELSEEVRAKSTCARAAIHERIANGMDACRIRPKQDAAVEDWAADYVAPLDLYMTPTGRQFVVECDPAIRRTGVAWCNVGYRLRPGLNITYAFEPYHGLGPIPIDAIIAFDHALRNEIEGLAIKQYPWPDQSP
ncbi:MAG TPA: hypothetical protein VGF92_02965 [Stellaceae bacterium]|jgi:hypothetical protein